MKPANMVVIRIGGWKAHLYPEGGLSFHTIGAMGWTVAEDWDLATMPDIIRDDFNKILAVYGKDADPI